MDLEASLSYFNNEELVSFISPDLKAYLPTSIDKKSLINYIKKNIITFFDKKTFVVPFLKRISEMVDISEYISQIHFVNGTTKKDSKRILLTLFELKYSSEKITTEYIESLKLPKRFYELLDYQFLIKEKVVNFVTDNIEKGNHINKLIIHMPTGTGKTKTSVHTIISLYQKNDNKGIIVWLAHTSELLNQARNAFISAWDALGNKDIRIVYDEYKPIYENDTIYFMTYNKLISFYKNGFDFYNNFRKNMSICVCDEAHKCLAEETYYALEDFMVSFDPSHSKTLIGLTATPGRKYKDSLLEGDNLELALMFDKHIFSINTNELQIFKNYHNHLFGSEFSYRDIFKQDNEIIRYFQDRKVLAKIKRVALKYDTNISDEELNKIFDKKRTKDYSTAELKVIGNNKIRNDSILKMLKKLDSKGIPTILFACSNEQGKLISDVLTLCGIKNNCIFGDTHDVLRKQYIKDFDDGKYNILINNSILTTGFDSPRIKCVFITRPTNSIVLYSQMLGRGLRGKKMGGNEECLLIDVVDNLKKFNDENFAFNYFSVYWR